MHRKSCALGLAVVCVIAAAAKADIGLGTKFADAVLEHLELGGSYNIRELRGIPYTVLNAGDAEQDVQIEVGIPAKKDLLQGYEPIPDPNWVKMVPERHRIPIKGMAFSDIIITIPDEPQWQGRHFQADIWTHTADSGLLGAGVKSRIRFSIGAGPESLKAEKSRKAMVSLNFDLWPQALYVSGAEAGKTYNVRKREKKSFKLTNRSDETMEVIFKPAPWNKTTQLPEGYEPAPDLTWLKFKPSKMKVKPNRVEDVDVILEIPKEYQGKKLAFLFYMTLPSGTEISTLNRVFVEVK